MLGLVGGAGTGLGPPPSHACSTPKSSLLDQNRKLRQLSRAAMNLELPDASGPRRVRRARAGTRPGRRRAGRLRERGRGRRDPVAPLARRGRDRTRSMRARFRCGAGCSRRSTTSSTPSFTSLTVTSRTDDATHWKGDVRFDALARTPGGEYWAIKAKQAVEWERVDAERPLTDADGWRIVSWELKELATAEASALAFEDVLDAALPVQDDRNRARTSIHEFITARFLLDMAKPPEERTFHFPHRYLPAPGTGPPPRRLGRRHQPRRFR